MYTHCSLSKPWKNKVTDVLPYLSIKLNHARYKLIWMAYHQTAWSRLKFTHWTCYEVHDTDFWISDPLRRTNPKQQQLTLCQTSGRLIHHPGEKQTHKHINKHKHIHFYLYHHSSKDNLYLAVTVIKSGEWKSLMPVVETQILPNKTVD